MRRIGIAALAALMVFSLCQSPAGSQEKPAHKGLDVAEFMLDNGLRCLVVNRPGVPVVSSYVWYHVGAMDERAGETGMAHFLEHMMFKGSRNYAVGDVDKVCAQNGGSNNAFTSYDFTAYYIDLPKSRYAEALKIEADRMRHLTLDQAEFDAEKKVVQSESDIYADDPGSQLWAQMNLALHGPLHPYAHPVLGWPADVTDTTRRDMRLFYDRHYHPNHATLILSGDITVAEAKPVVTRLFGGLPRGPELARPKPVEVTVNGPKTVQVKGDSEVIQLGRQYLTVPETHADAVALSVLGTILGRGVTSRLYRALVEEHGVATDTSAGHDGNILSGSMWVWAELSAEYGKVDLTAAMQAVIDDLIENGVTEAELSRARNRLLAGFVFGQESASNIASALGQAQVVQGDWRELLKYPDRIRAVTAADIKRVAGTYLRPERSVTGWLVPELEAEDLGTAAPDAEPQPLPIKRHVLSNGLRVLMLERPGLPVLSINAGIRSGRAAEKDTQAGLSQFTGSLLDAGTRTYTKQQLAELLEGIGGSASTGADGVSVRVLSDHSATGLDVLAETMLMPIFPQEEIELLKRQTLAAIEAEKDETASFARAAASAAIYSPGNPLGRPARGTADSVSTFTRELVAQWHQQWFRPDNCIISVVGDFNATEMLKQIEARFGGWAKPGTQLSHPEWSFKRPEKLQGEQAFHFSNFDFAKVDTGRKRIAIDHPGKDQVVVRLQTLGVTRDNPDYYALLVMDHVLGTSAGFTDRFSKILRDQMGLAYSTYANMSSGSGIYPGSFLGYIGTRPENVEVALKVMYQLIGQIRDEPVSEDELRTAKDYLKGSFVFELETTGQLASLLTTIERYQLGSDHLVKYVRAVEAVSVADIQRVARKYLVPEQMVEVLCGPITRITPAPQDPPEGK
ncbi:MAG: insulinase family protein [Planctomycetes bacterium]|nr:insulinase family protein [Planctomycetota bacterium]MCW8134585.1 insulinase family protein [Planctomycetota bacterium]